jgi:hypothetical protein
LRNIFDQYTHHENRLTHALVSALAEDPVLIRKFVRWITGVAPPKRLEIVEQQLPGEYETSEQDYEQRGLPDAWIHDDDQWALIIESKVSAKLSLRQLEKHYQTAKRRGFGKVTVLAIDVTPLKQKLPKYVKFRSWKAIYAWLSLESASSDWAKQTLRYMEVAERKWPVEGYLKEGTLTEFTGIHFDKNNPYSYGEAKRLIRLMMEELREHPVLKGVIDPKSKGRKAITGKDEVVVWDFVRLRGLDRTANHTAHPHFTLVINHEEVRAFINLPNSMEGRFRRPIVKLGEDGFFDVISQVNDNMKKITGGVPGAYPFANMIQRRFASQRAKATIDGRMHFDLRTAFSVEKGQKIIVQDQWLRALYSLIEEKHSNLEWAVGMAFPYEKCAKTRSPKIIDALAGSWLACKPILDVMPRK